MHRAEIVLEDWQFEQLKSKADAQGKTVSEFLREVLAQHFGAGDPPADHLDHLDGLVSDPGTTGRAHDEYLYSAKKK